MSQWLKSKSYDELLILARVLLDEWEKLDRITDKIDDFIGEIVKELDTRDPYDDCNSKKNQRMAIRPHPNSRGRQSKEN